MMQLLWKQYGSFSKKLNVELPYYLAFHIYVYTQNNWKGMKQILCSHLCRGIIHSS